MLVGGSVGLVVGGRLPERVRASVFDGLGLLTVTIGASSAIAAEDFRPVLLAILFGVICGELADLDGRLARAGDRLQAAVARPGRASRVSEAWVTTTLLFCVGPLAILGAFDDALRGDLDRLVLKSTLDGFAAIAFAASLGWGVLLSAGSVLVYQGLLTLGASGLERVLDAEMIDALSATGGVIILGLGLNLLRLTTIRVANFLPALVFAPVLVVAGRLFA